MRKNLVLLLCAVGILAGSGLLLSQAGGEDAKFIKIVDTYLDEYWKFYPTSGIVAGYGKYADKLEDFSEGSIEKRGNALDAFNKDLVTKIAADKLSPETQIDREILLDAIDFELFRLDNLVPQQFNPLFYNEVMMNSLRGLFAKGSVDAAKLAAATARAKALPGFIKQAKENLQTPPKEYTDAAIKQFPAILDYYKTELPKAIESSNGEAKAKFQAEWSKAVAALEDWGKFLSSDLLAKSTGNFRLGPADHGRLLQLTGQNNIMIQELIDRTKADINNIKRRDGPDLRLLLSGHVPRRRPGQAQRRQRRSRPNYVIKGVLDKIKGDHIAKADLDRGHQSLGRRDQGFHRLLQASRCARRRPDYRAHGALPAGFDLAEARRPRALRDGRAFRRPDPAHPRRLGRREGQLAARRVQPLLPALLDHRAGLSRLVLPRRRHPQERQHPAQALSQPARSSPAGRSTSRTCSSTRATASTTSGCA